MADLSPAAQAVLDAANSAFDAAGTTSQGIAAALRAAADHLPDPQMSAHTLYAIADELEQTPHNTTETTP
jgi:hypothetical protein